MLERGWALRDVVQEAATTPADEPSLRQMSHNLCPTGRLCWWSVTQQVAESYGWR